MPTKYRRYLMGYNTRFQTQSASGSCVLWALGNTCSRKRETRYANWLFSPHSGHRHQLYESLGGLEKFLWSRADLRESGRVMSKNAAVSPAGVIWSAGRAHANEIIIARRERALTIHSLAFALTHTLALCAILFSCVCPGLVCCFICARRKTPANILARRLARRKAFDLYKRADAQTYKHRAHKLSIPPESMCVLMLSAAHSLAN